MSARTTHSDLAELLKLLAAKLEKIPAGYLVSDASTRGLITDAARILVEQDDRISDCVQVLRECRDVLPTQERQKVNEWLSKK